MKLIFELPTTIPPVSKVLSILTDRAKICVNDIQYNEAKGIVVIPIKRKELTRFRTSLLATPQPVYGQTMIDTVLIIKEVIEMSINLDDRLVSECDSCFTVLFGLNLDGNNVYLGSVEEIQGKALCQVFIKVKQLNIEFFDKDEK